MKCSIKKRYAGGLPGAPKPTKPIEVKEVQGLNPKRLEVREAKPAVVPGAKKRRTPSEAIAESARKKAEAKKLRKAEAIRLYQSGMTIMQIAEHMGLKRGAIYDYTRTIRQGEVYHYKYSEYDEDVARLFEEGKIYDQIADELGITSNQVNMILSRLRKNGKVGRRNKWASRSR